jgi:hypothetical protein
MLIKWQQPNGIATVIRRFSTTLTIIVNIAHKPAVRAWQDKVRASLKCERWKNNKARAGMSRREVLQVQL